MNLFTKKNKEGQNFEDYSTLSLPFVNDLTAEEDEKPEADAAAEPVTESTEKAVAAEAEIKVYPGGISPLDALKRKINTEIAAEPEAKADSAVLPEAEKTEEVSEKVENEPSEPTSLLEKCLPYIYDEEGISQIDTKPDYTLESVDDIIRSAEKRASEKIAERYKLTDKNGNKIKLESETPVIPKVEPQKRAQVSEIIKSAPAEKISLPQNADILFDDFSGKRTVVTPTESITTTYSKLTELHTGIEDLKESSTVVMPAVKAAKSDTMEDIMSRTRPVNIKDAPAIKPQKSISVTVKNEDLLPEVDDDFKSAEDTKRIGLKLKRNRLSAFLRLVISAVSTVISAVFVFLVPETAFAELPFVPTLIQFALLVICTFANINIFSSFKNMFTKNTDAAAPVALSVTATVIYLLFGLIIGEYQSDSVLLTLLALCFFNLYSYMRESAKFSSFKIVASRMEKKAITLIDDQKTATSMARSSIEGEVLAVGVKRTSVLTDFIKFSSADTAFGGFLGTFIAVFGILSVLASVITGVSHHSALSAFCTLSVMLSIIAMPTYSFAEFMPLCDLSRRLFRLKAMVCSKYSASRIEQANALVISSAELFPSGSIELYDIKPLGANNIDHTLSAAASVAEAIKSPLASVFADFVQKGEKRKAADTVKYEDNLGISGWVGDDHYFIGNRTLLEAHSIRVPSLEVDRKILHKGYFPIYVAVGQRACALLIIKYNPVRNVKNNLIKLTNAGITLLIDNCDSNITAGMLSEYYGIYEDSIKIMDHKGVYNYKSAVNFAEFFSAHAAFLGKNDGYFAIVIGALKLHTLSNLMYALHIILTALFCTVFVLAGLDGRMAIMSITVCALIELVSFIISLITYLIARR